MTAHTPGPWKIDEANWVWGPDEFPIAVCDTGAFEHKRAGECCANADLIAAAPDLLAALQALVGEADLGEVDLDDADRALLDNARAAIAKATGQA